MKSLLLFSLIFSFSCAPITATKDILRAQHSQEEQERSGVALKSVYSHSMGKAYLEQAKIMQNEGEYERAWNLADQAYKWFQKAEQESGYLSTKKKAKAKSWKK